MHSIKNNQLFLGALLYLGTLFVPTAIKAQSYPANPIEKDGWTLDFSDEFNAPMLDLSKFTEHYLPHWSTWELSKANYILKDGTLVLKIDKDQPGWTPGSQQKISGIATGMRDGLHRFGPEVQTIGHHRATVKYETKYGYFELRAKVQVGGGIHSAWWMVGSQNNPTDVTEIDIFEILGNRIGTNRSSVNVSVHPWADPRTREEALNYSVNHDLGSEFHIYGFEWDENGMKFYFDNKLVRQTSQQVDYPMVTILSLYESPSNLWSGQFDPNAPYPKTFEIDYFRVYKKSYMYEEPSPVIEGQNIAIHSIKGANVSWNWLKPPSNLGDNNVYSTFESTNSPTFPEYLYFDWEQEQSFNSVTLKSFFAKGQAPTSWDIEVSENGFDNWRTVASESQVNWASNDETVESKTTLFDRVSRIKSMRLKIKSAHLTWSHYAINEVVIKDNIAPTAQTNLALDATPVCNGSTNTGSLTDGNLKTAMQSRESLFFIPQDILLRWNEAVNFNTLKFHTWYGAWQGITLINVYASKDGKNWDLLLKDYRMEWTKQTQEMEEQEVHFEKVENVKYLNIIVKEANRKWNHFAINELEVFNK